MRKDLRDDRGLVDEPGTEEGSLRRRQYLLPLSGRHPIRPRAVSSPIGTQDRSRILPTIRPVALIGLHRTGGCRNSQPRTDGVQARPVNDPGMANEPRPPTYTTSSRRR